jgi:hypothetical protein
MLLSIFGMHNTLKVIMNPPTGLRRIEKSFALMASACALVVLFWFGWLYPLVPSSAVGWVIELFSGVAVFLYGWACIEAILWLQSQKQYEILYKLIGAIVALSLGGGIFGAAYFAQEFVARNFSYFGR